MEERPETAKNLTLEDFNRKEFVQALDVQTQALTDNVEATCDILAPVINLLPSLDNDHKEEDVDSLVKMLPRSLQPTLCVERAFSKSIVKIYRRAYNYIRILHACSGESNALNRMQYLTWLLRKRDRLNE